MTIIRSSIVQSNVSVAYYVSRCFRLSLSCEYSFFIAIRTCVSYRKNQLISILVVNVKKTVIAYRTDMLVGKDEILQK